MRWRIVLGAAGVAAGAFGLLRLLQTGWHDVLSAAVFLVGGVVVHDALVAPLTIVATVLGTRLLPPVVRARVTLGLVVLLTVTVSALPAITRAGARADNPTLLPRDYRLGWLVLALAVLAGTLVVDAVVRRHARRAPTGPPPG